MDIRSFLKENAMMKENVLFVPSTRFQDEDGIPVSWVTRPLFAAEHEAIREKCFTIRMVGKKPVEKWDQQKYLTSIIAASVIEPDLKNAELQNSYGAMGESDLLSKMLYAGEFDALVEHVQTISGIGQSMEEKIDEAKNS